MTIPWPIEEYVRATCGPGNRRLAVLVAYFDESGTHGDAAKVVAVSGFLGDSMAWAQLERPWKKALAQRGHQYFHATDCSAIPPRGIYANMDEAERNELSCELAAIAADDHLVAVGAAVYRDDWNYALQSSPKLGEHFGTMYHLCVCMALAQVNLLCREKGGGEPAAIVFAQQGQYDNQSIMIHEAFKRSPHFECLGNISIAMPQCVLPLQIADLYCYENYCELLTQLYEPGLTAPKREQLRILSKGVFMMDSRAAALEMLHKMADGFDAHPTSSAPAEGGS